MVWSKIMSRTDAQQKTGGYPVQYLRFIKGKNPQDNQSWFRNTFFSGQVWTPGVHGRNAVEECTVPMNVIIDGAHKGMRDFRITHDHNRKKNNSTPNTYLHYDNATVTDLRTLNITGKIAKIDQLPSGDYELTLG